MLPNENETYQPDIQSQVPETAPPPDETDLQTSMEPIVSDANLNQLSDTGGDAGFTMYTPENTTPVEPQTSTETETTESPVNDTTIIRWSAAEHIDRDQSIGWYFLFALVCAGLMAVSILLIKSWTFTILIPVMAVALVFYVRRPPLVLDYTLTNQGLYVADKLYAYNQFKSFVFIDGDDEFSLMLVPTKRFAAGLTIYFSAENGEQIVDILAARLPMERRPLDSLDRLLRRLRI